MQSHLDSTKAIIKSAKHEAENLCNGEYYNLPDNRFLFLSFASAHNYTKLQVFNNDDLGTCLATLEFYDECRVICILPDGTIILNKKNLTMDYILRIDSKNLKILSQQFSFKELAKVLSTDEVFYTVIDEKLSCSIDNQSFFTIIKRYGDDFTQTKCIFTIYELVKNMFNVKHYINLSSEYEIDFSKAKSVLPLGGNRYCCRFESEVLIFELCKETAEINELAWLDLGNDAYDPQNYGYCMTVLPNGQLLTYCNNVETAQVWDTNTFKCINEWNWGSDTTHPATFDPNDIRKANAFSDSCYLLLNSVQHFYLFNMEKMFITEIIPGKHNVKNGLVSHILSSEQIVTFLPHGNYSNKDKEHLFPAGGQLLLDTNLMFYYRNEMEQYRISHLWMRELFKSKVQQGFPAELATHIMSFAFSPQMRLKLTIKARNDARRKDKADNEEEIRKENQFCRLM